MEHMNTTITQDLLELIVPTAIKWDQLLPGTWKQTQRVETGILVIFLKKKKSKTKNTGGAIGSGGKGYICNTFNNEFKKLKLYQVKKTNTKVAAHYLNPFLHCASSSQQFQSTFCILPFMLEFAGLDFAALALSFSNNDIFEKRHFAFDSYKSKWHNF